MINANRPRAGRRFCCVLAIYFCAGLPTEKYIGKSLAS
jgi:hypothetical protein